MKQRTTIIVAFFLGVIVGALGLYGLLSNSLVTTTTENSSTVITPLRSGSVTNIDKYTSRYENATYAFSLEYPKDLVLEEFKEGEGAMTIVFQKPGEEKGFQIFIVPYVDETISPERLTNDLAGASVRNQTEIVLPGNTHAVHFESESAVIGESTEVWFIRGGYLYEITTYAALDSWLAGILSTLRFSL